MTERIVVRGEVGVQLVVAPVDRLLLPWNRPPVRLIPTRLGLLSWLLLLVALTWGCEERECRALKGSLLSSYDPYADRCESASACSSDACDGETGVCRCDEDRECRSRRCSAGLCANPNHDLRLTRGLLDRGLPVRPLCERFLAPQRALNTDPSCARVFEFLEDPSCPVCDEAALILCGCRQGAARHECLVALVLERQEMERVEAELETDQSSRWDEASELLCEDQVGTLGCESYRGPPGSPCGHDDDCQSRICRDTDPSNNLESVGDDPRDWRCADPCRDDGDCAAGWECDLADTITPGGNPSRPYACVVSPSP